MNYDDWKLATPPDNGMYLTKEDFKPREPKWDWKAAVERGKAIAEKKKQLKTK